MAFDRHELKEAVAANVEDFADDPDMDDADILSYSVQDALDTFEVSPMTQKLIWPELERIAKQRYNEVRSH